MYKRGEEVIYGDFASFFFCCVYHIPSSIKQKLFSAPNELEICMVQTKYIFVSDEPTRMDPCIQIGRYVGMQTCKHEGRWVVRQTATNKSLWNLLGKRKEMFAL